MVILLIPYRLSIAGNIQWLKNNKTGRDKILEVRPHLIYFKFMLIPFVGTKGYMICLLYTSPSQRD